MEDTSLSFDALGGLPGPYIKWFFDKIGCDGLNKMLAAYENKSARAICAIAYVKSEGLEPIIFIGETPGKIVPARGPHNFGWDPVFEPDGFEETYAEMNADVKNAISHRGRALAMLVDHLGATNSEKGHDEEQLQCLNCKDAIGKDVPYHTCSRIGCNNVICMDENCLCALTDCDLEGDEVLLSQYATRDNAKVVYICRTCTIDNKIFCELCLEDGDLTLRQVSSCNICFRLHCCSSNHAY